jgi:probable rRNA maturation factor
MEKDLDDGEVEIIIEEKEFVINCFFDNISISPDEHELYKASLEWMAKSFQQFKNKTLQVPSKLFVLSITICDDNRIQELNSEHRSKDKVTDVLSFPLQENIQAGEFDNFLPEIELGDLFICKSICERQAEEFSLSYQEEFIHLATHGFLHVCGFDHEIGEVEEKLMEKWEESIILHIKSLKNS